MTPELEALREIAAMTDMAVTLLLVLTSIEALKLGWRFAAWMSKK